MIRHAVEPRDECEVLAHGEVVEQPRLIGKEGEVPLGVDRIFQQIASADVHAAAARRDDAGDRPQGRRLAGAVRADEPEHFSGTHAKRQVANGSEVAEQFGEPGNLYHERPADELGR